MKRTLIALLVASAIGIGLYLALARPAPSESCRGCNVLFILADTLRADHLGSYGYRRDTSPFLDRLAQRGVQFDQVRSQASCTFPSVNSILTSRYPQVFLDPATRPGIPPSIPALPEILKRHRYATAAVSASPIVRRTPGPHNPVGGFGRGFDSFDESCNWRESTCVTVRALERLADLPEPFFLYLHYMDPHDPYTPLPALRGTFAAPYTGDHDFIAAGDPNPIRELIRQGTAAATITAEDMRHFVDLYDEEILSLDAGLERLFAGLEQRRLLDRTIVVVAADHGEEFMEHGSVKHCYTAYDTEAHVPLLLRLPGLATPGRRPETVQNVDIVPTLLDYLEVAFPPAALDGRSLRPLIAGGEVPPTPAFTTGGPYHAVSLGRFKLLHRAGEEGFRLYDLDADPGETRDVGAAHRRVFHQLRDALEAWQRATEAGVDDSERLRRAREIEEELRALGYLG